MNTSPASSHSAADQQQGADQRAGSGLETTHSARQTDRIPHARGSYQDFLRRYPDYAKTLGIDLIRDRDFPALQHSRVVYLDYTGSALPSRRQIQRHTHTITESVFGNPHSANQPSLRSTQALKKARTAVLDYFNARPSEYDVIFTANATAAIKLVAEAFPFSQDSTLALLADNHNSVLGVREFAGRAGAQVHMAPVRPGTLCLDEQQLWRLLDQPAASSAARLFAFPAQSNFSGVRHDLAWVTRAQQRGWRVLLDAAAYTPTSPLDLSAVCPDFVALSFYKMFGWPTGVGCLLARRQALEELKRPWFSGGTVTAASTHQAWHVPAPLPDAFEDGTPNFLNIVGVPGGLDFLHEIDLARVSRRLHCLTSWLLEELAGCQHSSGQPLCVLYGPRTAEGRGATVALNLLDANGQLIDERLIEHHARRRQISLRTGCFCNPGVGETVFDIDKHAVAQVSQTHRPGEVDWYLSAMGLPTGGAIRVSLGHITNFADVATFLEFVRSWRDWRPSPTMRLPARAHC